MIFHPWSSHLSYSFMHDQLIMHGLSSKHYHLCLIIHARSPVHDLPCMINHPGTRTWMIMLECEWSSTIYLFVLKHLPIYWIFTDRAYITHSGFCYAYDSGLRSSLKSKQILRTLVDTWRIVWFPRLYSFPLFNSWILKPVRFFRI